MFAHYMYVVECVDGTLYTGYATDIEARVRVHNTGKGAKYTRTRLPVSLLAKARFYTKQRAMSAEAYFKQLDRDKKDALLAQATQRPFEEVLAENIPALSNEPVHEWVARQLSENQDEGYRDFMAKLTPSIDPKTIVGVRTPALRKIAKQLAKRDDLSEFFKQAPHKLFEENQLHSFAIGSFKDYDEALREIQAFLPYIDNWATCDQLPNKVLMRRPEQTLELIQDWIDSDLTYTARYGIETLMQYYLDDLFQPQFIDWVVEKHVAGYEKPEPTSEAYYMNMMRAWFLAEAMAKQPDAALPYLEKQKGVESLDEWTRKKAIQKSIESFRVSDTNKDRLRAARKL